MDEAAGSGQAGADGFGRLRTWWTTRVLGAVDHAAVIARRREDGAFSEHYLFMIAMSAGIAVLGLLLSSPAVVIGAMLLSPLMSPIMGLGFALAIGDWGWVRDSLRTLLVGSAMAVLLCAALVFVSPIQGITSEIVARTRPNLFDLFVALFSAMAGAYAMIRGKEGAIVGVAIATALMPPLAVVGFGLAMGNATVFSGALLLFATNFITIALTAFVMARIYGFRADLSPGQSRLQHVMLVTVFLALAVPLALSLQRIAWEANAQRLVRSEIADAFDPRSQIDALEIDFAAAPVGVHAVVFTPTLRAGIEGGVEAALAKRLGEPVALDLVQYQVSTSPTAAERAQLAAARERDAPGGASRLGALALRLALAAGVPESEVLIDEARRRALVRAAPLPGASLATYRALEARIAGAAPEWRIELIPPAGALDAEVGFADGEPDEAGAAALDLAAWGAARLGRGVLLTGPAEEAETAAARLRAAGAEVMLRDGPAPLRAGWVDEGG